MAEIAHYWYLDSDSIYRISGVRGFVIALAFAVLMIAPAIESPVNLEVRGLATHSALDSRSAPATEWMETWTTT